MSGPTSKTIRWDNVTLVSQFNCEPTSSSTPSVQGSGFNRETICIVKNLCVDAERGAWIHVPEHSGEIPMVNVVAADPGSDAYYRPTVLDQFPVTTYRFVDETIFLYGRDSTNRPSWTMNNLLPLHSMMARYEGSSHSWFMRVSGQENEDVDRKRQYRILDNQDQELDTNLLAPHGREIIFNPHKGKPLAAHHISPPSKSTPTCFARAVIGLQSRCTRPFCENMIGGTKLTESLRTNILTTLSSSMIRFQKTDPSIVHAPSGENVAVVSQDNLTVVEGESAPRSRIHVALLGRYGNTSIPNANALELSLLARGFSVKTIHLDYPSEISLAQAAQLFSNQSILVAPQGDALGYSTWMSPGTVVVSILPRFTRSSKIYTDRMMAFGKRFFAWDCQSESCVQPDRDLAHECIEAIQNSYEQDEGISAIEFEEFANMKQDFRPRSVAWKAISDCYTRDVSRRINVEELTILIEGLAKDFSLESNSDKEESPDHKSTWTHRRDLGEEEGEEEGEIENESDLSVGEQEEEEDPTLNTDQKLNDKASLENDPAEDEGEDYINVHEYDEQEESESKDKPKVSKANPADKSISPPVLDTPEVASPKTLPTISSPFIQYQVARPLVDFVEFCKQGVCCGSARISEYEAAKNLGRKGLTPCAASMSSIVFGVKNVWGLVDDLKTVQDNQKLVWQVDLGRNS
ncbi:hypothetical protein BGZ46_001190, partial [Entomortierella lignicola]